MKNINLFSLMMKFRPAPDGNFEKYKKDYSRQVGEWLKGGIVCYQFSNRRSDAFQPLDYCIGTTLGGMSYVDDLTSVMLAVGEIKDPIPKAFCLNASGDFMDMYEIVNGAMEYAFLEIHEGVRNAGINDKEKLYSALEDLILVGGGLQFFANRCVLLVSNDIYFKNDSLSENELRVVSRAIVAASKVAGLGSGGELRRFLYLISEDKKFAATTRITALRALFMTFHDIDAVYDYNMSPSKILNEQAKKISDWLRRETGFISERTGHKNHIQDGRLSSENKRRIISPLHFYPKPSSYVQGGVI